MSAQLGTMRVTEQIDALEVMGVNPKYFSYAQNCRLCDWPCPFYAAIFDFVGNIGVCIFYLTRVLNIDTATYLAKIDFFHRAKDIIQGLIKAAVFGFILSSIGTHKGFETSKRRSGRWY